ncbi:hypothetical protein [Micromonospora sp. NPDC049799]|uniref:WXG100 family type VII secretion target n=1 Tax=Micromonospora sp. NPDC049799 TaxID=3154741 RepID=UPI0033DAFA19
MGIPWLDIDPDGLRHAAGQIVDAADRLAATPAASDGDALLRPAFGGPAHPVTRLWAEELARVVSELHDVAGVLRSTADSIARVDEEISARLEGRHG